jgi:hypothetical protein
MVGANGVNNFGAEGDGGKAGGANMGNTGGDESAGSGEKIRNTALAWLVEQSLTMPRRVETVLQVPPPAALVVEPGTTYTPMGMGMGMGGQSGAVEKATRAHRRRTKILSAVHFC